ncbi:ATP-binding protein [Bacillus sp. Bva_UNVM-123]|uniref:ATP-binding protein n=1 Tax=Bacillus sp. Bva_UNVM-123 TaxID=2829798 RepID=UPI00391F8A2B
MKSPSSNQVSYGMIELNPEGAIQKINNEGKRLLSLDESDSSYLFHRITNNEIKTKLHECFMGKCNEFIVTIDTQPHFFLFHRTFKEQRLDKIHIYIFNVSHIQSSHEHNNWNNQLLSSIGEMAAGIAHEVRNPLTAVKGFLQLMEQSFNQEYAQIAKSELDRAIQTLNDLMSVSKPEFSQEKHSTFNICSEIEAILLLFQNQLYHINLIKKFEHENAMISGRKDQIKKALFNLIKNAIEAMAEGGTLIFEQYEDAHGVHLSISDSGMGIPKDKLRLLGTPFFTLKQDGKGMGLAQVFNAIQSSNGKISVSSETGLGTTFFLSFTKTLQHSNSYTGGHSMIQSVNTKRELAQFLIDNLDFYKKEWIQYIHTNKSYLTSLLKESGLIEEYEEEGNPIIKVVTENILELKTEEIMDQAKERGYRSAKKDFPIHLSLELFQSARGIIWNAIKVFYVESKHALSMEEFFALTLCKRCHRFIY